MLLFRTVLDPRVAVDVEAAVAAHVINAKIPVEYESKVKQLVWNLGKSPGLKQHPPHILVNLDNASMAAGTDVEQWVIDYEREMEHENTLVNSKHTGGTSLLKCRRCKSKHISTKQVQTRGADEAMTVFCECDSCGLRWKM